MKSVFIRTTDSSLDDIKYVLNPTFTCKHVAELDLSDKRSRAIDGTLYLPGIVGLNNIKANDYCNVILQALSNVTPLRDYFLDEKNYAKIKRPPGDSMFLLVQRFGELMRKLWNPRNFKAHVSPHEMLQAVVLWSGKKFQFTEQGKAVCENRIGNKFKNKKKKSRKRVIVQFFSHYEH